MSTFLYGDIVFKTKPSFAALCDFAESLRGHNLDALHLKFGGNVSNQYARSCAAGAPCLPYEITDSILQNTAEELLAPMTYCDVPPFRERLRAMEAFVRSVFSCENVSSLYLNFNVDRSDGVPLLTCGVPDFSACCRKLWQEDPSAEVSARMLVTPTGA